MAAKGTPATLAAQRAEIAFTLHEYTAAGDGGDAGYGAEAAAALGVDPARVFKTLVVELDSGLAVAVAPVTGPLDLKALAAALGAKRAALAEPGAAERATGYVVGGISPLGQRRALPMVLDESALAHPTVFVSAGRRGLEIALAPADLLRLTNARAAPLARR
ncbi:MAG: Cys-tRNA(Pro) deacylase [Acidimicrobiales bacterium]